MRFLDGYKITKEIVVGTIREFRHAGKISEPIKNLKF